MAGADCVDEAAEFSDHKGVTGTERLQTLGQIWPVVFLPGCPVLVEVIWLDAGGDEGIALQMRVLGANGFGDSHVADPSGGKPL